MLLSPASGSKKIFCTQGNGWCLKIPSCLSVNMPPYHATHVALSADDAQLYVAQMGYAGESMVMSLGWVQKQEHLGLN
jgi:hypothetical protein